MAKRPDKRPYRGLCLALGCLLTSLPAVAGVQTPQSDKATPTSVTAKQASPAAQPDFQSAQEKPAQQSGGPSADAQESYRAQMREVQEQLEEVNLRAKTATTGLIAIKSDMASQGLGLRSDVLEAEARMDHLVGKAQREISSGDAVSAEQDLQMAGYSVDFIERFLGR